MYPYTPKQGLTVDICFGDPSHRNSFLHTRTQVKSTKQTKTNKSNQINVTNQNQIESNQNK